nr:ATP-binding protein [Nocardia alni]
MDPSPMRRGRLRPSPRTQFSQRFGELFEAAGNPTLRRVAAAAEARMRAARGPAHKGGATVQRISDWKAGRNVPAKFDSLLPVLLILIDEARKSSRPVRPALLDAQEWQRLWTESNAWDPNSDTADVVCPYLGLAAYCAEDAEVFFGRARPTAELAELVRGATESGEGGAVILVGASGAGKSSLLQAGLIPALADPVGEWAVASMTPGSDPVGALLAAVAAGQGKDDEGEGLTANFLASALSEWGIGRRRLLVVDQLEEFVHAVPGRGSARGFPRRAGTSVHSRGDRADCGRPRRAGRFLRPLPGRAGAGGRTQTPQLPTRSDAPG